MPCWNTIRISYSETTLSLPNTELAVKALEAMGFTVNQSQKALSIRGSFQGQVINAAIYDGKLVYEDNFTSNKTVAALTTAIRRNYSAQAVTSAARKFGWRTQTAANGRMTLTRR